ncbi:MAG: sensor histidine kinase [Flavisolibacter sp.]|nr:sensor histidine kinase [Flavisolibacter sp.]
MPKTNQSRKVRTVLVHIAGWAAYLFTLIMGAPETDTDFWLSLISVKAPVVLLFYVCLYYIYPKFLASRKYGKLVWSLFLLILLAALLRFFITVFITQFHFIDDITNAELNNQLWMQLRLNLAFAGISLALWLAGRNVEIEKAKKEMENEVLNAELKALKYQINPHFLYNTLSFMYARALPVSGELSKAIGKLSEIMRYSLTSSTVDDLVSLQREVQHIHNFIELQQLRFSNGLYVAFHHEIIPKDKRIAPLILITFVENAFKHGVLTEREYPVKIDLLANNEEIKFQIANKINHGTKEKSSGIGLSNIKKRLQLAYPGKHQLLITQENDFYTAQLTLKM